MKKNAWLFSLVLFLIVLCLTPLSAVIADSPIPENISTVNASGDYWVLKASIPVPMNVEGLVTVNGKIYAFGNDGDYTALTYMYDPEYDNWTQKTSMPPSSQLTEVRLRYGVAVYQDKIYVIGGEMYRILNARDMSYDLIPTGANQMYDPATDSWSTKASMPTAGASIQANTVNGKIYIISGMADPFGPTTTNVNEVYDPTSDTWTTASPIPYSVYGYSSAVVDKKIYVFAGFSNLNQIFDTETNNWTYGERAPIDVTSAPAVATTGAFAPSRIYLIGGRTPPYITNATQIYDPNNDSWTFGASFPTTHDWVTEFLAATVLNDTIYVVGGIAQANEGFFEITAQYIPSNYTVAPTPSAQPSVSVVVTNWVIIPLVAGGFCIAVAGWKYRKKKKSRQ